MNSRGKSLFVYTALALGTTGLLQSGPSVEQTSQGTRPPVPLLASFDGLGVGFTGLQPTQDGRNPSDNSLAVGPNHIVQIVNSRFAIFTKKGALFDTTGKLIYGAFPTNKLFEGFGGVCEARPNGDAVVRYDQLANRWLYVMPIFRRPANDSTGPYSMCYALSQGADPTGPFYRYEFKRPLFPDYPRPAVWPDGYYIPTSTSDNIIQKHVCVVEREKMLAGLPAREQCRIIDGVNFLNNADIDGPSRSARGRAEHHDGRGRRAVEKCLRRRRNLLLEVPRRLERHHQDDNHRPRKNHRRAVSLSLQRTAHELRLAAGDRSQTRRAGRQADAAPRLSARERARIDPRAPLRKQRRGRRWSALVRIPSR